LLFGYAHARTALRGRGGGTIAERVLAATSATRGGPGGPPGRLSPWWASLTETEREIAEPVARGLTNRELGDRMFLSPHTVAFPLRRTYRKLDIASRSSRPGWSRPGTPADPEPRQGGARTAAERTLEALRADAEGLRRAMASRASIEQAKGALVALGRLGPGRGVGPSGADLAAHRHQGP
jgi:DNA-binding CsgD family transcriptional regulator